MKRRTAEHPRYKAFNMWGYSSGKQQDLFPVEVMKLFPEDLYVLRCWEYYKDYTTISLPNVKRSCFEAWLHPSNKENVYELWLRGFDRSFISWEEANDVLEPQAYVRWDPDKKMFTQGVKELDEFRLSFIISFEATMKQLADNTYTGKVRMIHGEGVFEEDDPSKYSKRTNRIK